MKIQVTKSPSGLYWSLTINGKFISNYSYRHEAFTAGKQYVADILSVA